MKRIKQTLITLHLLGIFILLSPLNAYCTSKAECMNMSCPQVCLQGWCNGIPDQVTCSFEMSGGNSNSVYGYLTCTDIVHGITGERTYCGACSFSCAPDDYCCINPEDLCCKNPDDFCCKNPKDPCCPECSGGNCGGQ